MQSAREGRVPPAADLLDSYVSPLLLSRLAEGGAIEPPEARRLEAAVAAIDVQGFSTLAESLSRRGPAGIEELASLIDGCFGSLVDAVHDHGGAAHTFPGDAVIAVWPTSSTCDLTEATRRAARCARELTAGAGGARDALPLKGAVGAGAISLAHVGGFADRWELLVTGDALSQLAPATRQGRRGEVVLSRPAWTLLSGEATAEERQECFVLRSLAGGSKPPPPRPAALPPERRALLRSYLPDGLLAQIDSGQAHWLAEFRRLSVIFTLMSPRRGGPAFDPELIQRGFQQLQRALYRHEGGMVQLCHDDKGVVVLAATGLPGLTHEDDAERAALAGLAIHRELGRQGIDCRIGIATGSTFCGALGNRSRREYSVVGSVVNLAARLMEEGERGVVCDEATRAAVGPRLDFEERLQLDLKGLPRPVAAFRAAGSPAARAAQRNAPVGRRGESARIAPMIGREKERERMADWLDGLSLGREGVLAIRGEAGIGKSLLAAELVGCARESGIEVMLGSCDTLNATVAYHAWRPILEQVLQLRGVADPSERRARALEQVTSATGDPQLAPLLGAALPLELAESPVTEGMVGSVRHDNTRGLLARLICAAAERHRDRGSALLIGLEDAHWMDAASWALLDRLGGASGLPLGIAVTLRPVPGLALAEACLGAEQTTLLELDVLSEESTRELVRQRLGAEEVAGELAASIYRRSQGNPFFSEELVTAMRETGLVQVERGVARLVRQEGATAAGVVPDSVSGILESRIDRLSAELQLTLKAASVIGQHVEPGLLCAIHPMERRIESIERQLEELADHDLLRIGPQDRYSFKHAITRDVAYNRLLFSQRRQLHGALAGHLEGGGNEVAPEILFHHWRESGEVAKALDYVDATGANAMREGHYQHAIELFEYGLGSAAETGAGAAEEEIPRAVRWSHFLGEAQVAIGRHAVGRHSLEVGLQGLRYPVPTGRLRLGAAIARELVRQLTHRLLPRRLFRARRTPETRLVTASEAYEQLGYIHYASGETLLGIHDALKMLNLSERAAVSPVLARSYAAMALTVSVIPLRRLAALYERQARWATERLGDPRTQAYVDWISSLRAAGEARWDRVESGAGGALEPARRLADWRLQMMSLENLAWSAALQGDFPRALDLSRAQLAIAKEQGNRLWEVWALNSLTEARSVEGDEEAAAARCQRALDILAEESDRNEEIRATGLRARALLRLGRTDEALMSARRTADLIESTDLTSSMSYEGFAGVCEVMLGLAEDTLARGAVMPPTLRKDAQRSWAALKRFARVFPIGRPRCGVVRARLLRMQGRQAAAERALVGAVADAERLGMSHEQGLALLALGGCDWLPAERRRDALDRALALLGPGVERRKVQDSLSRLP